MGLGRAGQPPQRRTMDLTCHHVETIRQERTTTETSQAVEWDDLDKYRRDTIWKRTAQDRLTWRRHDEAFPQPRDTTAAQQWWRWAEYDSRWTIRRLYRDRVNTVSIVGSDKMATDNTWYRIMFLNYSNVNKSNLMYASENTRRKKLVCG